MILKIDYLDYAGIGKSMQVEARELLSESLWAKLDITSDEYNKAYTTELIENKIFTECCRQIGMFGVYRQERWIPSHRIIEVKRLR